MGYRSDIALTIRNEDWNNLVVLVKNHTFREVLTDLIQYADIKQNSKFTVLTWECVKWCEDFPEVQFIESFIIDVPHVFCRIGEDDNDCEYKFNSENISNELFGEMSGISMIIRKITINFDGEEIQLE